MSTKEKILHYLEQNAHLLNKNIADALSVTEKEVEDIILECEENGTIVGYKTLINWDKTKREFVSAIIEIKVQPLKGEGFDKAAKIICSYPEVTSCHLMSGAYDLMVTIEGKTLREVALFVAEKLAVIDGVTGTATHFVLHKYKDRGVIFDVAEKDDRVHIGG